MNCFLKRLEEASRGIWKDAVYSSSNNAAKGICPEETANFWSEVSLRKTPNKDDDSQRIADVLKLCEDKQLLYNNSCCLDIGCGTGVFSLEFAKSGMKTDLYDISPGMLAVASENMKANGYITKTYEGDWQKDNLALRGLKKKYDLCFSALNPAVTNPDTLDRMIFASRAYCMYLYSAGGLEEEDRNELDKKILGFSPESSAFNDVIFPLNYLYCRGYRPELSYTSSKMTRETSPEKECERIKDKYKKYKTLSSENIVSIKEFVLRHTIDGIFSSQVVWRQGIVMWHV